MSSISRIQVAHGRVIDPLNPSVDDIYIEDIAHALSNQCRFSGHVTRFYSVAEHSVRVSKACKPEDALWGLLHDATEAYLVDLPRPLKRAPGLGDEYLKIEANLQRIICEKFGLVDEMPESVHEADNALLMTEARDLLDQLPVTLEKDLWGPWKEAGALPDRIYSPLAPEEARAAYMAQFYILTELRSVTTAAAAAS